MSSFVLLTKYGPPDLIVEVGKPVTKDPVMLSGLFQAIMSFTNESLSSPIQVMQTKGFTVHFKKLSDDYVIIVGSNHTIVGLESIVEEISSLIEDGMKQEMSQELLESTIHAVLDDYLEFNNKANEWDKNVDEIPDSLLEILSEIPNEMYRVLFFGLLAGYNFNYPKTSSMDLNRNLVKGIQFLGGTLCSDIATDCGYTIGFHSKSKEFNVNGSIIYKISDVIEKTNLLKDLILVKNKNFLELKAKLNAEVKTLENMEKIFLNFDLSDDEEVQKIDQIRYMLGHELEHYLLLRLQRKDQERVKFLQNHVATTEWMSQW